MEPTNSLDEAIATHGIETITQLLSDLKILIKSNVINRQDQSLSFNSLTYTNAPTSQEHHNSQDLLLLSDHTLIKFIIARQMDSEQAFEMILKTYQWRFASNICNFTQIIPNNCRGVLGVEDQDLNLFAENIPNSWQNFVPYLGGNHSMRL